MRPVDATSAPRVLAPPFAPVERAFAKLMRPGRGGGALVVRLGGETVVRLCAGHADVAGRRAWTPETLAVSFSTTKGVVSTVVHRLAERGMLGYDDRVADHWPPFAAGGKGAVTIRDVLTHRAGLSSVRAVARRAEDALDHLTMEERLAAREVRAPTPRPAYHAITYGWVLAGLLRAITGSGLRELVRAELAGPLAVDGLHIGAPDAGRERIADPVGSALRHLGSAAKVLAPLSLRAARARPAFDALHLDGFDRLFVGRPAPVWDTEMPAVNGMFTADALATLYGALANGGQDAGARLLAPETTHELGRVQVRGPDVVLGLPMRWRLGYHQAFGTGREGGRAFGHYGYGGSGAWADPTLGLSVALVTNRIGSISTPLGDLTLLRLGRVVHECARRSGRRV